jgi:CubicO group peptidase (beta-lactamase class C family)
MKTCALLSLQTIAREGSLIPMRILLILFLALSAFAQELPKTAPAEVGLDSAKFQALEAAVAAGEFKKTTSVLVARRGRLAYERYFEGEAETQRDTRSVGKTIAGMLVGLAIQDGKLSGVQARILDLLPERKRRIQNPDPRKDKITVEDFLTMSSPLECNDWEDFSRGHEERMYRIEDWAQFILDLPIAGELRVGEKVEPPKYGRRFSYCTGGVFTLSEVITKATGQRTDKYAQAKLFDPLGIKQPTWVYSPLGVPMTGGGLRLTSRDLLMLAELYRNGGRKPDGTQLINEAWVKASITPHTQIDEDTEYGYLWWLESFKSPDGKAHPAFYMTGNGGNKIFVFPALDMSVVITATNYNTRGMHEQTIKILTEYILAAVR